MPVYLSERANPLLISEFTGAFLVRREAPVYDAVSTHPDIYMCRMPDGKVIRSRDGEIGENYPDNIGFNAICLDKYFIHNLKYTNPRLKKAAEEYGLVPINVRQGYTKCSCVVVDGKSIITADDNICKVLSELKDVDVLKIRQGHVKLPGFEYGFLGGASGRVGDTIYFSGDIAAHPDWKNIFTFISNRDLKIKGFSYPLEDIGSIIAEEIN